VCERRAGNPALHGRRQLEHRSTFVIRYSRGHVHVHSSARKHGVTDIEIRHAFRMARASVPLDLDSPIRRLILGPAASGALLELVVLELDDGRLIVIHAMKMRSQFAWLLEGDSDGTT
jgi:hypothetical protein